MQNEITKEEIKALAAANGLTLPDERLERVLRQYRAYMQLIARLDAFELEREAEPETIFTLAPAGSPEALRETKKGGGDGNR